MRREAKGIGLAIVGAGRVGLFRGEVAARHPAVQWIGIAEKNHNRGLHVAEKIGAIARPEKILMTADLPKTRSGKIMRRLLRDIAEGRALGDVTTLADPTVVASLKEKYEEEA